MAKDEIHKDDIGTQFEAEIRDQDDAIIDISGSTRRDFVFTKPGTSGNIRKTGSFVNTGVDGLAKYVTVSGDLDEAGMWCMQLFVTIGANQHHSDIETFKVHKNL